MGMQKPLSEGRKKELLALAKKIDVTFKNWNLLHQALTHTSYANEVKKLHILHNERLEFLGDAVLELVVSTYLFQHFPHLQEGELTKARASVVCEATLARHAALLQVGDYLLFGKGELITGGRERASILADAFESIIGAIYLDHGIESASAFVLQQLHDELSTIEAGSYFHDFKTSLQEVVQKNTECKIQYNLLSESGPDHEKIFRIAVLINQKEFGVGWGKSKKEAEQHAAKQALIKMNKVSE